jgi:hypothetical protein
MSVPGIADQVGSAFSRQPGISDILSQLKGTQEAEESRLLGIEDERAAADRLRQIQLSLAQAGVDPASATDEASGLGSVQEAALGARQRALAQDALEQQQGVSEREDEQAHDIELERLKAALRGKSDLSTVLDQNALMMNRMFDLFEGTLQESDASPGAAAAGQALVGSVQDKYNANLSEMFAAKWIRDQAARSRNPFADKPSAMELLQMKEQDPEMFQEKWGDQYAAALRHAAVWKEDLAGQVGADFELGEEFQNMLMEKQAIEARLQAAQQFPQEQVRPGMEGLHDQSRQMLEDSFSLQSPRQIDDAPLSPEAQLALPPGADEAPDPISAPQFEVEVPLEVSAWIMQQPEPMRPYFKLIAMEYSGIGDEQLVLQQMQLFEQQLAAMAYADQLRGQTP